MIDTTTSVAGVTVPFPVMNGPGAWGTPKELGALLLSASGAVMLPTVTVHPFVHPQFRSLHNPGFDKLALLARQLVDDGTKPVGASVCGANTDEIVFLANAFRDVGVPLIEVNLSEAWTEATLAPFDDPEHCAEVFAALVTGITSGLVVRIPDHMPFPPPVLAYLLRETGVTTVSVKNDFGTFEKLILETGDAVACVVRGGVASGWDLQRTLAKGAVAVQIEQTPEGVVVFERLAHEWGRAIGQLRV